MKDKITKGKSFNKCVEDFENGKVASMGYISSYTYFNDPVHVPITASRYKFVSKMFAGLECVLEIGCADAFYSTIVAQRVGKLVATDYDPVFIEQAKQQAMADNMELRVLDLTKETCENSFDGIYALDVFEHIHPNNEDMFIRNITRALKHPESNEGGG